MTTNFPHRKISNNLCRYSILKEVVYNAPLLRCACGDFLLKSMARCLWLGTVILATFEGEIRRIEF
jgi:hypothetical protein